MASMCCFKVNGLKISQSPATEFCTCCYSSNSPSFPFCSDPDVSYKGEIDGEYDHGCGDNHGKHIERVSG